MQYNHCCFAAVRAASTLPS